MSGGKAVMGKGVDKAVQAGENLVERREEIDRILEEYENHCNKEIDDYKKFTEEEIKEELAYNTDLFMLMKVGDRIRCDCGDREIPLEFVGKKVVYKGGAVSPTETDIPQQVKNHEKGCFGTCLLEEPSRHPGKKAAGGNPCEPFIVGTSWLETYNNAKADELRTALSKQSWLACRYMGRIMSAGEVEDVDVTGMTEEEAFEWMLKWAKGEYIPQVLLDKITDIYAGGEEAVNEFRSQYPYRGTETYENMDKFDSKFIAWSKFVNNLWEGKQAAEHLVIRPIVLKAISMVETHLGEGEGYNGTINIMQSITIGDGTLWLLANYNPYPKRFYEINPSTQDYEANILVWRTSPNLNTNKMVDNGYVQFVEGDYFIDKGNGIYEQSFNSQDFLGKADIGDKKNLVFKEAIKTINTHSSYPEKLISTGSQPPQNNQGEIIMTVYNQQSVDMSLYAACLVLANKANTEREATGLYNSRDNKVNYALQVEDKLQDFGNHESFIN